jgi:hypothetical protein
MLLYILCAIAIILALSLALVLVALRTSEESGTSTFSDFLFVYQSESNI